MVERFDCPRLQPARDQQDRYCCLRHDSLCDRPHAKPVDPAALVRSQNDHVRTKRTRVEQDDLRGVTRLNPVREFDVRLFGPLTKFLGQRVTVTSVPAEGLIRRDRLYDDELGAVMFTERERVLEGATGRFREVDRCENATTPDEEPPRRAGPAMLLSALALMSAIALRRFGSNKQ